MKNVMNKVFRTLIAILILFIVISIIELVFHILLYFCPVLYVIIVICVILFAGYFYGNVIFNKDKDDKHDET